MCEPEGGLLRGIAAAGDTNEERVRRGSLSHTHINTNIHTSYTHTHIICRRGRLFIRVSCQGGAL